MKLPKRILPIVERLRAEVPKPDTAGLYCLFKGDMPYDPPPAPRWETLWYPHNAELRAPTCPMGMVPGAAVPTPAGGQLPGSSDEDIIAFAGWWDSLTLDKACKAVEEIWK
jgi:hypothetical protein